MEFLEGWEKLIPVTILGEAFDVPENNNVLRVLQYLELEKKSIRMDYRDLCWNQACEHCRVHYRRPGDGTVRDAFGCTLRVFPGMEITRLPRCARRVSGESGQSATEYATVAALSLLVVVGLAKIAEVAAYTLYLWAATRLFPPFP